MVFPFHWLATCLKTRNTTTYNSNTTTQFHAQGILFQVRIIFFYAKKVRLATQEEKKK